MYALYLVSVWLHILAATAWIGGMFFLVLVVVPWIKKGRREAGGAFLRETGEGFRAVGWACFVLLLVTGTFNLWVRGVRFSSFVDSAWLGSAFGKAVLTKLSLFAGVLVISAIHDFSVGPRAARVMEQAPTSPEAERLRKQASQMGRANALLALALVGAAVVIVRGWPF